MHLGFGGRATWGANFAGEPDTDENGHETHVAGTVGTKCGVAKKCNLIAVKVFGKGGSGHTSSATKSIEWAVKAARTHHLLDKAVANLSLVSPKSLALNSAVAAAIAAGFAVVASAGSSGRDAASTSPASEPLACTVGSINISDAKAGGSNFGASVDIFARGVDIASDWYKPGDVGVHTTSGTSTASVHVAGLGLYLYAKHPGAYPTPARAHRSYN